jgi:hypothetical protein
MIWLTTTVLALSSTALPDLVAVGDGGVLRVPRGSVAGRHPRQDERVARHRRGLRPGLEHDALRACAVDDPSAELLRDEDAACGIRPLRHGAPLDLREEVRLAGDARADHAPERELLVLVGGIFPSRCHPVGHPLVRPEEWGVLAVSCFVVWTEGDGWAYPTKLLSTNLLRDLVELPLCGLEGLPLLGGEVTLLSVGLVEE